MKKINKKIISALLSASVAVSASAAFLPSSAVAEDEHLFFSECEDLELSKELIPSEENPWEPSHITTNVYGKEYPGYSGEGFVWIGNTGSMSFKVDAPETGMYRLTTKSIMYLEGGERPRELTISNDNGTKTYKNTIKMSYTDNWNDFSWGDFRLEKGENTITFSGDFCIYDTVTLDPAPVTNYAKADSVPCDPKATSETKGLMKYLSSVYGKHMLSGQQEIYGGGHDKPKDGFVDGYEREFEWIHDLSGEYPAIRGFDLMNYNPLYGWDDGSTERIIEWTNERNGIATVCWHINVPKDFASYKVGEAVGWEECSYKPEDTDFNTANAVIEGTKEYDYFMLAIKDLAEQLQRVQDAGVPVLFRPLHEAEGNPGKAWFWWGDGGAEVYVQLWKLLYTQLTEEYGLHNLIWEYNSYTYASSPAWYPGDEYVDIVGYDKYNVVYNRDDGLSNCPNESAITSTFNYLVDLTDGKKMVAMPENDTVPKLDNLLIEKAAWLYFCIWYDNDGDSNFVSDTKFNNPDTLKELYQSDYVITLDELPEDWKSFAGSVEVPKVLRGDINKDGDINIFDFSIAKYKIAKATSNEVGSDAPEDMDEDGLFTLKDVVLLSKYLLGY